MNYIKIYNALIDRARIRNLDGYCEHHHIIPRCLGGSDNAENIVKLTPEEHYVAHQVLTKIYKGHEGLLYAAMLMTVNRSNNKLYGWLRRRYSESKKLSSIGEKNNQFGTMWISNINTNQSKKIRKDDQIPNGWIAGRNKQYKTCIHCKKLFYTAAYTKYCSGECKTNSFKKTVANRKSKKYKNGYSVVVNGISFESISQAADHHGIGHETARMRFKSPNFPNWEIKVNLFVA